MRNIPGNGAVISRRSRWWKAVLVVFVAVGDTWLQRKAEQHSECVDVGELLVCTCSRNLQSQQGSRYEALNGGGWRQIDQLGLLFASLQIHANVETLREEEGVRYQ